MIGIYKLVFSDGSCYIGQSQDITRRFNGHLKTKGVGSPKLQKAFQTLGDPKLEILDECTIDELDSKEEFYIKLYNPTLNVLPGGFRMAGLNHPRSKYSKEVLQDILTEFLTTDATYQQIADILEVDTSTVHDLCKRRKHLWLTEGLEAELLEAHDRRYNKWYTFYTNDGKVHRVNNISKFESELNLPTGTIQSLLRSKRTFNKYGISKEPIRRVKVITPEKEEFECTEFEAYNYFHDESWFVKKQLFQQQKESKGFLVKYLPAQ